MRRELYQVWNADQLFRLKQLFDSGCSYQIIANEFGVNLPQIYWKLSALGWLRRLNQKWLASEISYLRRQVAAGKKAKEIGASLNRSVSSIFAAIYRYCDDMIDRRKNRAWTTGDLKNIAKMVEQGMSSRQIAAVLGCQQKHIDKRRRLLTAQVHVYRKFSTEDISYLNEARAQGVSFKKIAQSLDRPASTCTNKWKQLNLAH